MTWDQALATVNHLAFWQKVAEGVDNIKSGPFGTIGYILDKDKGAAVGASLDAFLPALGPVVASLKARGSGSSHIGASGKQGMRASPFNPSGDRNNRCLQCVASLIGAIANKGFVKSQEAYPGLANKGSLSEALNYLTKQTGVTFGQQQQNTLSGPLGTDFVVFTRHQRIGNNLVPGHVMFGSNRGGMPYFYDPQTGGNKIWTQSEPYIAYPIRYAP